MYSTLRDGVILMANNIPASMALIVSVLALLILPFLSDNTKKGNYSVVYIAWPCSLFLYDMLFINVTMFAAWDKVRSQNSALGLLLIVVQAVHMGVSLESTGSWMGMGLLLTYFLIPNSNLATYLAEQLCLHLAFAVVPLPKAHWLSMLVFKSIFYPLLIESLTLTYCVGSVGSLAVMRFIGGDFSCQYHHVLMFGSKQVHLDASWMKIISEPIPDGKKPMQISDLHIPLFQETLFGCLSDHDDAVLRDSINKGLSQVGYSMLLMSCHDVCRYYMHRRGAKTHIPTYKSVIFFLLYWLFIDLPILMWWG